MAMTQCKECGAQVSTKADACPQCGAKRKQKTSGCLLIILAALLLPVFGFMVSQCSVPMSSTATQTAPTASAPDPRPVSINSENSSEEETRRIIWIEKSKDAVREKLKDPDSAKFKDVKFSRGTNNIPMACGQVNSKNSLGGYGGFQRFVSAGRAELTFLEEQMEKAEFVKVWNQMCVSK